MEKIFVVELMKEQFELREIRVFTDETAFIAFRQANQPQQSGDFLTAWQGTPNGTVLEQVEYEEDGDIKYEDA